MKNKIEFYMDRAVEEEGTYNLYGALACYDKVIELDNKNVEAYYRRGCIRNQLGFYMAAMEDFNTVLELNPVSIEADYVSESARFVKEASRKLEIITTRTIRSLEKLELFLQQ